MAKLLFNPSDYPEMTYEDVCLLPNNPLHERVLELADDADRVQLNQLSENATDDQEKYGRYRSFLLGLAEKYSCDAPVSRDDVQLQPKGSLAKTPVMVANMDAVVGKRMAEAIARVGGIATVPQDKQDHEIKEIVEYLRSRHPVYETPICVSPQTKVHEFNRLIEKRSHGTAIVQNGDDQLLGVISKSDLDKEVNPDATIERFVRRNVVSGKDGISPLQAIEMMEEHHVNYLPIKNEQDKVIGVLPKIDAAMRLKYEPNIDPNFGGLRAAFTIGALNNNPLDKVRMLLDLGIYDIQFDTAHSDQGARVYRNIEKTLDIAAQRNIDPAKLNIIAGNMVTRQAVRDTITAGAKYVKGGIGPGGACTTRIVAGVGRPQLSMILECAEEAHKHGGYLIADGGIKLPRDVSIALAADADYVMLGSLFAGTYESPSEIKYDEQKRPYKVNFGMASARASNYRTIGRARRTPMEIFREIVGHRAEGISEQRVYMQPGRDSVALLHHWMIDGATSGVTYAGARSIQEYSRKAIMALQMPSGYKEGEPKASM